MDSVQDSPMYDSDPEISCLFTQKVEEVTESEMKKIKAQKMEGEVTIRTLEQVYRESKKNLIYAQKKFGDARKKAVIQTEQIDHLKKANVAIVAKFDELKNYQNEIILTNVNEIEKVLLGHKNKNVNLTSTLQMIFKNDNYLQEQKKIIFDKKITIGNDLMKIIEEKKLLRVQSNELLLQLKKEYENVTVMLNNEMSHYNYSQVAIEDLTKKITNFEANHVSIKSKLTKEHDILKEEMRKLKVLFDNNVKIFHEKETLNLKMQEEICSIEKMIIDGNEKLKTLELNKDNISKNVQNKRNSIDTIKQTVDKNFETTNNNLKQIETEIESFKKEFSKNEENMQIELKCLYEKYNKCKILVQKLETCELELKKLTETKSSKLKDLSNLDQELNNVKDHANDIKKYEQTLSDKNKIQSDLQSKIKKLNEEKKSIKLKFDTIDNDNKKDEVKNDWTQQYKTFEEDLKVSNEKVQSTKGKLSQQSKKLFDYDDSDESDDEVFSKSLPTDRLSQSKKSQSDLLFDNLSLQTSTNSQSLAESKINYLNDDVFKAPLPYTTPLKKKNQPKSYKK